MVDDNHLTFGQKSLGNKSKSTREGVVYCYEPVLTYKASCDCYRHMTTCTDGVL